MEAPDYANPFRVREQLDSFLAGHGRPAFILEGAEQLFALHRRQEILDFLGGLRERLAGRGPFLVTFDPRKLSEADALDLRAAVVAPDTRGTLEALSTRSGARSCAARPRGRAASPRRCARPGWTTRPSSPSTCASSSRTDSSDTRASRTRITERGEEAIRLLVEMDAIASAGVRGNAVLAVRTDA